MATIDLLSRGMDRRKFLGLTGTLAVAGAAAGTVGATCHGAGEWDVAPGSARKAFETAEAEAEQQAAATETAVAAGGHNATPSPASARPKPSGELSAVYDASLPPLDPSPTKNLVIEAVDADVEVAPGVTMAAWTFDGVLPGKVVHVRQGDSINFTLRNRAAGGHSIDFHAARTPWDKNYVTIVPQQELSFTWTADYPGVFMYHCGTDPVLHHIANGMYGTVVVDPPAAQAFAPAREYVLVQSEFYLSQDDAGRWTTDLDRALAVQPDFVVFNGGYNQYQQQTLQAAPGELIRLYVVNAGPTLFSAFHVIGTIFDRTYVDGNPANVMRGISTWTIPPGGGATFELTIPEAGLYPFVTHSFAYTGLGAVGLIEVA